MSANFLTGPVDVAPAVREAFGARPASHRGREFIETLHRTRTALRSLVNASHVAVLVGSGTLANDAVAAQLATFGSSGLILANGEFGERLIDHARRWKLGFAVERRPWGESFDWGEVARRAKRHRPGWIWSVLTETSTGVANPLHELRGLSEVVGAELCLDAVSAVGLMPVDLRGVRFATAVSGKGLASFPGLAAVFHDGRLASGHNVPRYLDLSVYEADGVPFTHSSNLLAALECSLAITDWQRKFERVAVASRGLRAELQQLSLPPLARARDAAAGVLTFPIPSATRTADVADALVRLGIEIAWQSGYLLERNWMQVALMGEFDDAEVTRLPGVFAGCVARFTAQDSGRHEERHRPSGHPADVPLQRLHGNFG